MDHMAAASSLVATTGLSFSRPLSPNSLSLGTASGGPTSPNDIWERTGISMTLDAQHDLKQVNVSVEHLRQRYLECKENLGHERQRREALEKLILERHEDVKMDLSGLRNGWNTSTDTLYKEVRSLAQTTGELKASVDELRSKQLEQQQHLDWSRRSSAQHVAALDNQVKKCAQQIDVEKLAREKDVHALRDQIRSERAEVWTTIGALQGGTESVPANFACLRKESSDLRLRLDYVQKEYGRQNNASEVALDALRQTVAEKTREQDDEARKMAEHVGQTRAALEETRQVSLNRVYALEEKLQLLRPELFSECKRLHERWAESLTAELRGVEARCSERVDSVCSKFWTSLREVQATASEDSTAVGKEAIRLSELREAQHEELASEQAALKSQHAELTQAHTSLHGQHHKMRTAMEDLVQTFKTSDKNEQEPAGWARAPAESNPAMPVLPLEEASHSIAEAVRAAVNVKAHAGGSSSVPAPVVPKEMFPTRSPQRSSSTGAVLRRVSPQSVPMPSQRNAIDLRTLGSARSHPAIHSPSHPTLPSPSPAAAWSLNNAVHPTISPLPYGGQHQGLSHSLSGQLGTGYHHSLLAQLGSRTQNFSGPQLQVGQRSAWI